MKLSQYSIALVMLVYQSACAQSLLWRISGNGATGSSYLYGTIHIKDKRVFVLTDSVRYAQEHSQATVLELDLGAKTSSEVSSLLMLPEGKTLADFYSEEQLQTIQSVVEGKVSMPFSVFESMRPAALLSVLSESYFSSDMPYALDEYFQRKAVELGKEVIGLETVREQFTAIDAISPDMIYSYITDTVGHEDMSKQMISAYLKADFDSLTKLLSADSLAMQYSDELLTNRNKIMAERIERLVKDKRCFVAIGAGHLRGEQGVLDLLAERGFVVEPVFGAVPNDDSIAGLVAVPTDWVPYTTDRFSLLFPSQPTESSAPFTIEDKKVTGTILIATDPIQDDLQFFFTELPAIDTVDYVQKLTRAAESSAQLFGGTVHSVQPFCNGQTQGIETEIDLKSVGLLAQKHIAAPNGYYVLQILSVRDTINPTVKNRFFGSFSAPPSGE